MNERLRFSRPWRRFMNATALMVIVGVLGVGHPEIVAGEAAGGCAEFIQCATEGACQITEGDECHDCENGIQACVYDQYNQCNSGPACDIFDCQVKLCVDWEDGGGGGQH